MHAAAIAPIPVRYAGRSTGFYIEKIPSLTFGGGTALPQTYSETRRAEEGIRTVSGDLDDILCVGSLFKYSVASAT